MRYATEILGHERTKRQICCSEFSCLLAERRLVHRPRTPLARGALLLRLEISLCECSCNSCGRSRDVTQRQLRSSKMASRIAAAATVRAVKGKRTLPTRAALVLTQSAIKKIKEILHGKNEYIGLKVGVSQRGCNGLSYTLDYATEKSKLDEEVVQDGVRVIIDRKAQLSLLGTEMDYVEGKLSCEFVFNNPNIKGTCGCGESFSV